MAFREGGWQKARMEQQMHEWFGHQPDYIITLTADFCLQCSDLEFYALAFYRETGKPKLCMRGHDAEELVGVVRRYGASCDVQEIVDAANNRPEVAHVDVARACGTCLLRLA